MSTTLPASTDYTGASVTQGGKKTFVATVRLFLSECLGTDSTPATVLSTLGGLPKTGGTMTGDITMSGASIIEAEGAAVVAAATTNIWATDGNTVHVTGNTTITSFGTAPQAGAWMKVIFDGTPLLTQGANLNINGGGSNVQIAADDFAFVYADTTTQLDVFVMRKSGISVVAHNVATQAEMEAFSSATPFVAPSVFKYHPSAVKYIGLITGGTGAITTFYTSSGTPTGTRNSAGNYTIGGCALSAAGYPIACSIDADRPATVFSPSTTGFSVITRAPGSSNSDASFYFIYLGDLP